MEEAKEHFTHQYRDTWELELLRTQLLDTNQNKSTVELEAQAWKKLIFQYQVGSKYK